MRSRSTPTSLFATATTGVLFGVRDRKPARCPLYLDGPIRRDAQRHRLGRNAEPLPE